MSRYVWGIYHGWFLSITRTYTTLIVQFLNISDFMHIHSQFHLYTYIPKVLFNTHSEFHLSFLLDFKFLNIRKLNSVGYFIQLSQVIKYSSISCFVNSVLSSANFLKCIKLTDYWKNIFLVSSKTRNIFPKLSLNT